MVGEIVLALMLMQNAPATQATEKPESQAPMKSVETQTDKKQELVKIKRIYVDSFGNTEAAQQMQAMVVASLTESQRLTVTEEKSKADAILRGVATESTAQETHAYSTATAAGNSAMKDATVNTETTDSAKASVRLVNQNGDVIWTSTQESKGGKFKGASADVADKIVKQLIRDINRAQKPTEAPAAEAK